MVKKMVTVNAGNGIHARPASLITNTATKFAATVKIAFKDKIIDCKSIIGILSLGATGGSELELQAEGPDAQDALDAITTLFESNFGE
ncbi:MAG: HPr family phosphocarrier protein [Clostridia bacterium]|nr:HPr family phosphocarrier protein [Clostridia bacterium]